jgi:hypothetical protein
MALSFSRLSLVIGEIRLAPAKELHVCCHGEASLKTDPKRPNSGMRKLVFRAKTYSSAAKRRPSPGFLRFSKVQSFSAPRSVTP